MLELRPPWCHQGDDPPDGLQLLPWRLEGFGPEVGSSHALDQWVPGAEFVASRTAEADVEVLRASLGLPPTVTLGLAASWYCRATNLAGLAESSQPSLPTPLESGHHELALRTDAVLAGTVELETALVLLTGLDDGPGRGSLIWSDQWTPTESTRLNTTAVLEGDELRWPIAVVDFRLTLPPEAADALWHVRIDYDATPYDPFSSSVMLEINSCVLEEKFGGDLASIGDAAASAMRVDLLRELCRRFLPEWSRDDYEPGSVGAILRMVTDAAAGGWEGASHALTDSASEFDAALWSCFGDRILA